MKRITYWPQAFLGLTFNWGALLGWTALINDFNLLVMIPLYLSGICWTLMYDTIYAFQDKKYDRIAGIKSSALAVDGKSKLYLSLFAGGNALCLSLAGIMNGHGVPFYLISVGGSLLHSIWQIKSIKENDARDADKKFKSNVGLGFIISLGIVLDIIRQYSTTTKWIKDAPNHEAKVNKTSL